MPTTTTYISTKPCSGSLHRPDTYESAVSDNNADVNQKTSIRCTFVFHGSSSSANFVSSTGHVENLDYPAD